MSNLDRAARLEIVAAAIANARGARRGAPRNKNIVDVLPAKFREEVFDDADAVLDALEDAENG